jgi:hypothetical protein
MNTAPGEVPPVAEPPAADPVPDAAHLDRRGKDLGDDLRRGHRGRRRSGIGRNLLRRLHERGANQPADGQQGRPASHPEQGAAAPGEP